jgi:hypothetical protein
MKEIKRKAWIARNLITISPPEEYFIFSKKPELIELKGGEVLQSGTILNVAELINLKRGGYKKVEIIIREVK